MGIKKKKQAAGIQYFLDRGLKLFKSSIFPKKWLLSPLAKIAYRILSAKQDLLIYKSEDFILRCYRQHWVYYSLGIYEPITQKVLRRLFRPGMVFEGGGASIGFYSMLPSKIVGDSGLIYSFEPHPEVYKVLRSNISANSIKNVKSLNVALGASAGISYLNYATEPGSHTLVGNDLLNGQMVEVVSLDDIIGEGQFDLVKLDLEGFEVPALQGMSNILRRKRKPIIIMEFCSHWLGKAKISPLWIIEFLESHGYKLKATDDPHMRGPFDLDAQEKGALEGRSFN